MNASAAMDEICRRFNPSVLAGWVIINPGTGVVEDGGGWLNPHLNPPDDPKMEDPKVIAYEQFTTIAKRVQQAQGGKARRVTIAVRSAQFDLLWVLEKLFVIHRDCS